VPSTPRPGLPRFLGVRLADDELRNLDDFQRRSGSATRSDAVRALVREFARPREELAATLPVSVRAEIEELVEDGWAQDEEAALALLVAFGLREFTRLHAERVPALRGAAQRLADRRRARRRAEGAGRRLLER
jgi:hypothetical protein